MYKITAYTEDGEAITFEASATEDLITSALKRNVILLTSCREGGCATVQGRVHRWRLRAGECQRAGVASGEEEDGFVLLCCTYPRSDMSLNLPYTSERISFGNVNNSWQGDIVRVETLSSNVAQLVIRPLDPETGAPVRIGFVPGQYFDIEVPGTDVWRSYSMANEPEDAELEFLMRLLPGGFFSDFLHNGAAPGLRLRLRGPSGIFGLRENGLKPRYFVAGGTGLSPAMGLDSMTIEKQPTCPSVLEACQRCATRGPLGETRAVERPSRLSQTGVLSPKRGPSHAPICSPDDRACARRMQ